MEEEEYLDLVDEHDQVIGRKLRSDVHREHLHNYRAVNLFIVNAKGELWIPRRTADKQLYPLGLDFSCSGHVASGETYETTLRREMQEELNINIDDRAVGYLGSMTPAEGFPCFSKNHELRTDEAPHYNATDFVGYEWLTPGELLLKIDAGEYAKSGLPKVVRKFYAAKNAP